MSVHTSDASMLSIFICNFPLRANVLLFINYSYFYYYNFLKKVDIRRTIEP